MPMTKTIRAKFKCNAVEKYCCGMNSDGSSKFGETAKFSAVGGEENRPWSEYTPSGSLSISITNQEALGQFEPGKDYYLDFSEPSAAPVTLPTGA